VGARPRGRLDLLPRARRGRAGASLTRRGRASHTLYATLHHNHHLRARNAADGMALVAPTNRQWQPNQSPMAGARRRRAGGRAHLPRDACGRGRGRPVRPDLRAGACRDDAAHTNLTSLHSNNVPPPNSKK
jgi:hypothetical protein